MARRELVQLVDDLDGSIGAVTTVQFGLDGVAYEIDLSVSNAARLRRVVAEYVRGGRWVGGKKLRIQPAAGEPVLTLRPKAAPRPSGKLDAGQVRAWARTNGIDVSPWGRIPKAVEDQYRAAQQRRSGEKVRKR